MIAYKLIVGTDNIYIIMLFNDRIIMERLFEARTEHNLYNYTFCNRVMQVLNKLFRKDIFYLNVKSNNVKILVLCIMKQI